MFLKKPALSNILFFFLILGSQFSFAQNSSARFLFWQPSAKSHAMGGIGTSLHWDAYAAYYNPASLAFTKRFTLVGSFVKPFPFWGNIAHSFIGGSIRTNNAGTFAFSANLIWKGPQAQTDKQGNLLSDDYTLNWQGKLSYALPLTPNFSVGASMSLLRINLAKDLEIGRGETVGITKTLLFDLGVHIKNLLPALSFHPFSQEFRGSIKNWLEPVGNDGLNIGIALLNYGSKISFVDPEQSDNPPSKLMIGTTYLPISSTPLSVLLGIDIEKQLYEPTMVNYVHLGGQISLYHLFSFRFGKFVNTEQPDYSYATLGAGLHTNYFSLNIAKYTRSILTTWHYDATFSLGM